MATFKTRTQANRYISRAEFQVFFELTVFPSVNVGDADGYTALIMAAHLGQLEILDVLLEVSSACIIISFSSLFYFYGWVMTLSLFV